MKARAFAVLATVCFAGCTMSHKTYHAPSDARVKATQQVLTEKVSAAKDTATLARAATLKAQLEAQKLIALSKAVNDALTFLMQKVPAELRPLVKGVQDAEAVKEQMEAQTRTDVDSAVVLNSKLMQQQAEEETARRQAVTASDEYAGGAADLATQATTMRETAIGFQKQLNQQKFFHILWKIGFFLFIGLIIFLIIAHFAGWLAKWAGKLYLHV